MRWGRPLSWIKTIHRIGYQWIVHENTSSAAAIAFYSLLTLPSTVVFGVAIGRWAMGLADAQAAVRSALVDTCGRRSPEESLSRSGLVLPDRRVERHLRLDGAKAHAGSAVTAP